MRRFLPALLLLFAPLAFAQNQTIVTGTITDPNGVPYYPATVSACLTPATLYPMVAGQQVNNNPGSNYCFGPVSTASNGSFLMSLWGNALITCSPACPSTQWLFTVVIPGPVAPVGFGPQQFTATIPISGNSQDIGATLNAAGVSQLRPAGAATNATNLVGPGAITGSFSGTHSETGNVTFTGTVTCKTLENIRCVDLGNTQGWAGSDFGAWVNSAIANTTTTGSIVLMANNGDATVSTTILVDRPITLMGMGRAGRLVPGASFAGPIIKVAKTANSLTNQFNQQIGVRLQNIWIEDPNFRSQNTDGIWVVGTDELQTQDIEVKWLKGYSLQLDNNGNNNTPVRESIFRNFVAWGNGDPAQSKASIIIITNSFAGSDEINEIRFDGGGVKFEWWEAVRIGTGQVGGNPLGPRHIYFHNFQIEARQALDCAVSQGGCAEPLAVAPFSDNFHVLQGNNISIDKSSVSNAGQGKSAIRLDGASASPIGSFVVHNSVIGGAPILTGVANASSTGNTLTYVSGNQFQPFDSSSWVGLNVVITGGANPGTYAVSAINSINQLVLTTSPGNNSGVTYTVTSGGFGITESYVNGLELSGVRWLTNPNGNLNPTIANTGAYSIVEVPSNPPMAAATVFGQWSCLAGDCAFGLKNNTTPNGQEWDIDSKSDGSFSIFPRTNAASVHNLAGTVQIATAQRFVEQTKPGFGFASGQDFLWGDSVTHTPSWDNNNNGTSSPTGAWQCTNVTPVTVNANASTDQNLMACSVPAGTLNRVGRTLRIWLAGVYSTPAASTTAIVVKVKLGTLTLATWTTTALAGIQATNDQFNVTGWSTTQTAGATAAFEAHGNLVIDLGAGNTVADNQFADVNTATVSSVDTTATQTLQVTVAFTVASASNTATQRQLIVETVN